MKLLLKIMFAVFVVWLCVGVFLLQTQHPKAQVVMGLAVFYLSFVLMPVFIYYRYRDGKYKKYQLNDEKIRELLKNKENK